MSSTHKLIGALNNISELLQGTNQSNGGSGYLWLNFFFNTNYNTTTKLTNFEALYGFQSPRLSDNIHGLTKATVVDEYLLTRQQILSFLKNNLVAA